MSFLPQSRPFSYWSLVKLEIHSKFQVEHIKKCLDTMAISTLGAPLNTTVEIDKWIRTQWILDMRILKNLQKVRGTRCLPCSSSCSAIQAGAARNRQRRSRAADRLLELRCQAAQGRGTPYGTGLPQPWPQAQGPLIPFTTCWDLAPRNKDNSQSGDTNETSSWVV